MPASPTSTRPSTAGRTMSTTTSASSPRARTLRPAARCVIGRSTSVCRVHANEYSSCWLTALSAPAAGQRDGTSSVVSLKIMEASMVMAANGAHRGGQLPPQARPVDVPLERFAMCCEYRVWGVWIRGWHWWFRVHVSYRSAPTMQLWFIYCLVPYHDHANILKALNLHVAGSGSAH
jgi:hypothetical protein